MKFLIDRPLALLRQNYETVLYLGVAALLLLALVKPEIQLRQEVHNYLLVADVSQSMNTEDVKIGKEMVSRLAYTRHLMTKVVETSPCGTFISLGVFAAENIAMLFMPLEVCANYDEIVDTIKRLEWRMAWRGNSRISHGIKSAERAFDTIGTPAQMLFFTDGDEAPKVNVINKLNLDDVRIGGNVTLVGIGGYEPVPIPRYNAQNKWIGYWPADSNATDAANVSYNNASEDDPDPYVAYAEYDRYLSQQDVEYLRELAGEVGARYIDGLDNAAFFKSIQQLPPVARLVTGYSLRWLYLGLAGVLVLCTFLPNARQLWRQRKRRAHSL